MPKTVTITLNETIHTVRELRSRENAAWRAKLEGPFQELATMLESGPGTELSDLAGIAGLVRGAAGLLLRSVDTIKALLVAYDGNLEGAVEDAYDSEIVEAFGRVLELAYPFGGIVARLRELGSASKAT